MGLGGEHLAGLRRGLGDHHALGGAARGVHDAVQRAGGGAQFGHRPPGLLLVGDVGAQHHDAGAEVLDAPQPEDTGAGGVVGVVGGEPLVPCGGGGERGAAEEAEHRAGGGAREVFGHGQADAAEATGDEVDAAVAQPGALGVQGDPVEVAAPPVAPAQGEFGLVGGAGERGEHGADDAVERARGVVGSGDVEGAAGGVGGLLRDHRARAEQEGVLGHEGFVAGDVVHAVAQHVDGHGDRRAFAAEGLGEGEQAVEPGAAGGVQPLTGERFGGARTRAGGRAPQVDDAQAPLVVLFRGRGRGGVRGEGRDERGQVVAFGRVHGPGVAGAGQFAARGDAHDPVAGRGQAIGQGVTEGDAGAEHHPGVAGGAGRGRGREREALPARGVEPVGGRRGGRRRGPCPGAAGARRLDPVAAPLEGVAGQPYRRTTGAAVDGRPVDGRAGAPQGAQAGQQVRRVVGAVAGVPQRSDGGARVAPCPVGADEAGEVLAGADLQRHQRRVGEQRVERVAEPHRPAQVVAPVLGAGRLLVGDPGAGDVGQEREGRGVQGDRAHLLDEGVDGAVHVGGVEGVRGVQPAAADPCGRQPRFESRHGLRAAGDHAERGGVDRGDAEAVAEQGGGVLLREEDD